MWILVWKICLVATVGAFAVMSVAVSIGGAYDLRQLFQRLADDNRQPPKQK